MYLWFSSVVYFGLNDILIVIQFIRSDNTIHYCNNNVLYITIINESLMTENKLILHVCSLYRLTFPRTKGVYFLIWS